ncbi:hypothetical protein [Sphingomonas glaciei]|uniref:Uncharacterized protein n=1 Tax=Sphingomonas glaciei TaxID=2938948 RepID=A0ABY5MVV6_9SPHN|nr:hypothetical protein [Sphingomonas glaciei]UUR07594.1 hypothetical protein M1K48_11720 [Sphingomonas glaciei]
MATVYPPPPSSITSQTDFVLLGSFASADFKPTLSVGDISLRWLGQPATYWLKIDGVGEGNLQQNSATDPALRMIDSSGQSLLTGIDIPRPPGRYAGVLARYADPTFRVAFGTATSPTSLPTTGSRAYRNVQGDVGHEVRINVDFANRQISGNIDIAWADAWGPYTPTTYPFTPTAIATGSTEFALAINIPGAPSPGQLIGRFAGPNGEELMVTWRAEIKSPYDESWVPYGGIKILGS